MLLAALGPKIEVEVYRCRRIEGVSQKKREGGRNTKKETRARGQQKGIEVKDWRSAENQLRDACSMAAVPIAVWVVGSEEKGREEGGEAKVARTQKGLEKKQR